jgi:hypothetical protein
MDTVDNIMTNQKYDDGTKLIKLYAVIMLNYRQPLGDRAWDGIHTLFKNPDIVRGFSFLTGFLMGSEGKIDTKRYQDFIKDDL